MYVTEDNLETLTSMLTGNLLLDMDIRERIHEIKMKENNVNKVCSLDDPSCENCGS